MKEISSVTNPKIKEIIKLLSDVSYRKKERKFVVEGIHLVAEAMKKGIVDAIYMTEDAYDDLAMALPISSYHNIFLIKDNVAKKIASTVNSQNVFAVCEITPQHIDYDNNILLLDRVQDPGNVGTLIRSAASFNFKTVISNPNSVSYYNDKVIRSTQGNFFQINLVKEYLVQSISELKNQGYIIIGTQMHEESKFLNKVKFKDDEKYAVIIGNESVGISPEISELIDINVLIPMEENVESLNAAVAGSIVMYEISTAK
ncbi:rRNA methyltransferase [Mesoplasma lactucae ATCC 49193]|uniref:rRNA methyltransferase n=1 Tax=Mesoplasma lactucae ATCC 49193 TaxID=81460 RepID=A0A291ISS3_9MOLU|nr:rRNA methyltransferase [Mesoplasma lactucae ATCC 49193]